MRNKEFVLVVLVGAVLTLITSAVAFYINVPCGVICLLLGAVLLSIFAFFTKKRFEKINMLNNYLSLVCSGNYDLDISDNAEGELSILKNNLFKVITMLKTQNEVIEKDKLYLAESLADISHQLKTPLTSMMVITDLIKDEQDKEKRTEFVDIIDNQLEKMRWLILTLLKLSKLDAGTAEFVCSEQNAGEIINESLKPFMLTLDLKNISIQKSISDFTFMGDKNWSIEAIQNIIKNCLEHTDENGELNIKTDSTTLFNRIIIQDNGCGIDSEDLPHIFERFYHGKNASADSVGIGLALSKSILQKENATVTVKSQKDIGSEFEIRFYKSIV